MDRREKLGVIVAKIGPFVFAGGGPTGRFRQTGVRQAKRMLMSSQALRVIGALVEIRSMPLAA